MLDGSFHVVVYFPQKLPNCKALSGGEEVNLSLTTGMYFENCESSSQQSSEFGCKAAFSGRHQDVPNGIWRTSTGNGKYCRA